MRQMIHQRHTVLLTLLALLFAPVARADEQVPGARDTISCSGPLAMGSHAS